MEVKTAILIFIQAIQAELNLMPIMNTTLVSLRRIIAIDSVDSNRPILMAMIAAYSIKAK